EHLVEFRPPWQFPFRTLAPFWAFFIVSVAFVVAGLRRTHVSLALLFFALAALSLRHVRVVYDFAVLAAPVATLAARAIVDRFEGPSLRAALVAITTLVAVASPVDHWSRHPRGLGYDDHVFPRALFDVVRADALRGPAYVSDGWAGPVLGEFYPAELAFYDPRLEAYDPAFVRDVYQRIRYGEPGWSQLLDRYGVQLALLKYTSPREREFQGGRDNLRQLLARSPSWALVAFDDDGELFVRRDGTNAAVADAHAIPAVDPDRRALLARPRVAWPGLAKSLEAGPRSKLSLLLGAVAAADAGELGRARDLLDEARSRGAASDELAAATSAVVELGGGR
ncbi:MAG: hypothetical protein ACHREM_20235, partial [Polyangiales bacterium]